MAFEDIECIAGTAPAQTVPSDGVRVSSRKAAGRGSETRYIRVQIGAGLAKALCLLGEQTALRVQFGSGRDAGKVAVSVNVSSGAFAAKRDKQGRYAFTVNSRSADGLFALDFPAFTVSPVDLVHDKGSSPVAIFAASEAMLAVED